MLCMTRVCNERHALPIQHLNHHFRSILLRLSTALLPVATYDVIDVDALGETSVPPVYYCFKHAVCYYITDDM